MEDLVPLFLLKSFRILSSYHYACQDVPVVVVVVVDDDDDDEPIQGKLWPWLVVR